MDDAHDIESLTLRKKRLNVHLLEGGVVPTDLILVQTLGESIRARHCVGSTAGGSP